MDLNIDPWNPGDPRNTNAADREALAASLRPRRNRSSAAAERQVNAGSSGSSSGAKWSVHGGPTAAGVGGGGGGAGGRHGSGSRPFASTSEMLHHIGWHSILNLAISQYAMGLIGSFGSSWSQVTLSMMHRHHGGPVLGCSLRPGWMGDNIYTRYTPAGQPHIAHPLSPTCRRSMVGVCRGGELMYEGLNITWSLDRLKRLKQ